MSPGYSFPTTTRRPPSRASWLTQGNAGAANTVKGGERSWLRRCEVPRHRQPRSTERQLRSPATPGRRPPRRRPRAAPQHPQPGPRPPRPGPAPHLGRAARSPAPGGAARSGARLTCGSSGCGRTWKRMSGRGGFRRKGPGAALAGGVSAPSPGWRGDRLRSGPARAPLRLGPCCCRPTWPGWCWVSELGGTEGCTGGARTTGRAGRALPGIVSRPRRGGTQPASPLVLGPASWSPQAGIVTAAVRTVRSLGWPRRSPARPLPGSGHSWLLRDSGAEGPGRSPAVPWARLLHGSKETCWSPVPTCGLRAAEQGLNSSWLQEESEGDLKSQGRLR